jgi:hypothetical protein
MELVLEFLPNLAKLLFATQRTITLKSNFQYSKIVIDNEINLRKHAESNYKITKLMVVVSHELYNSNSWDFGQGNYLFEIVESFEDIYGFKPMIFVFNPQNSIQEEYKKLASVLVSEEFSHVFISLETDPGLISWNLDLLASVLHESWKGIVVGLSTDAVYRKHQLQFNRFIKIFTSTVIIGIDSKIDRKYLKQVNFSGPTLLPISQKSISVIDELLEDFEIKPKELGTVFVGKIYPYRRTQLSSLATKGLKISINPHIGDSPTNVSSSYVLYLNTLRTASFALNLSRAGGMNCPQLKSRVLEAPLFGAPVVTDEIEFISKFFTNEKEFIYLSDKKEVLNLINKSNGSEIGNAAKIKARQIAQSAFWNSVSEGCERLGLSL